MGTLATVRALLGQTGECVRTAEQHKMTYQKERDRLLARLLGMSRHGDKPDWRLKLIRDQHGKTSKPMQDAKSNNQWYIAQATMYSTAATAEVLTLIHDQLAKIIAQNDAIIAVLMGQAKRGNESQGNGSVAGPCRVQRRTE